MKGNNTNKALTFTGAILPLVLFKIDGLADRDFKILAYLFQLETYLSNENSDGWFFHSLEDISKELGVSSKKVSRALDNLYEMGLIEKKRQGNHKSNLYRINREYLKELESETGKSYKGTKRAEPKREPFTMIAEQKPTKAAEPKEEEVAQEECMRTLENHPEEDEELIDIISNICCGKEKEEASTILEQYIRGHRESEELINHYFQLWYEQTSEEEQPETDYRKRLFEHLEWYRRKNRPLGFEVMYEALDDTTVVQDIYSYDEVKNLFNEYKDMVQVA